jgi:hypothetical protein
MMVLNHDGKVVEVVVVIEGGVDWALLWTWCKLQKVGQVGNSNTILKSAE